MQIGIHSGTSVPPCSLFMNEGLLFPSSGSALSRKPSAFRPVKGLPEQRRPHLIPRGAHTAWLIKVGPSTLTPTQDNSEESFQLQGCPQIWLRTPLKLHCSSTSPSAQTFFLSCPSLVFYRNWCPVYQSTYCIPISISESASWGTQLKAVGTRSTHKPGMGFRSWITHHPLGNEDPHHWWHWSTGSPSTDHSAIIKTGTNNKVEWYFVDGYALVLGVMYQVFKKYGGK